MATKKKYRDFESAVERLEEITDQLEAGETSLEDSIKLYTEGLEIAQFCEKKLTAAQKKIKIIRKNNDLPSEEEFDEEKADE
ncbi:MAG: exodeoxyribonuclease VII small subunit [Candidatus Zixiibacteriota bacterium]|nr:MAG: exodeoxyribonuclease VII small subunit [candidate division Zixibacteria bacterium]